MIYDMQYRDGANFKKWFRADFPDREMQEEDEVLMEDSGLTMLEFFDFMGWEYDEDLDHNMLEVLRVSEDQISEAQITFIYND